MRRRSRPPPSLVSFMARKPHPSREKSPIVVPASTPSAESLSKRGKKCVLAGICVVVVGFCVLAYTDPAGQNWASSVSPFLLVAGYIVIGVGAVVRDP